MTQITALPSRAVLSVAGPDALTYLQGQLTNDVTKVTVDQAQWAGLLSPQGKTLFDVFLYTNPEGGLLLDVEATRAGDLLKRLTMFKLRAKVDLMVRPELAVFAAWGGEPPTAWVAAPDPRSAALGWRLIGTSLATNRTAADYDLWRLSHGVADGSRDLDVDKLMWLESNAVELHGVDFTKGCYVGQENTARMYHRDKLRKRLLPVRLAELPPAETCEIMAGDKLAGELKSHRDGHGMALLRLELIGDDQPLTLAGKPVTVLWPSYLGPRSMLMGEISDDQTSST